MPTPEARHQRANWICVEAAQIARRESRTLAERARIFEREVTRLMAAEPDYWDPQASPGAQQQPDGGFLVRF